MVLASKNDRVAVLALVVTVILLFFLKLLTTGDIYGESNYAHLPHGDIGTCTQGSDSDSLSSLPSTSKVAAILETRPIEGILPLILHFSSVLGPEWPMYIFTSQTNIEHVTKLPDFAREISTRRIYLKGLPRGLAADFPFHESDFRSEFLTQAWFWEELAPAEHILLFSADSIICSRSNESVDAFLTYDFIGAPMESEIGVEKGVSGGLSLRNRNRMLDVVRNSVWEHEKRGGREPTEKLKINDEDTWFWKKLTMLGEGSKIANLPNMEAAKSFAVGKVWEDTPFGYDRAYLWHEDRMEDILNWCPEYSLSMLNAS